MEKENKNPSRVQRLLLNHRRLFFYTYSYANSILNAVLNSLPPLMRDLIFKILLREIGSHSLIDYGSYLRYMSKIHIGNNVEINRGFQVYPSMLYKDSKIQIEDNVVIGPNVCLYGAGQNSQNGVLIDVAGDITIRKGAYIGGSSLIRYGVEIGANSIVAAGSVVVKDVPAGSVVGGNPASFIRKNR